ncbi:MAG TPA: SDR family oxidoreductase [Ilumatobacteraceae bacterium]|nr:SDR family oxidoreductase [Ilumatobacteraceae bacterium]
MGTSYPFTSALVTGASSGIGAAMVELLAEAGVPTVAIARRKDRLDALAARHPKLVEVMVADLETDKGVRAVCDRIAADGTDLVVNNAGFGTSGTFHTLDADRLDREVRLNIGALTRISHAALEVMVPRRRGFLLNVSSVASFQPAPDLAVYAATKAYVTSFSESIHEEVRGDGVHVTALCPGLTRTEFIDVSNMSGERTEFPSFMWLEAKEVAEEALHDVAKGRALSVPGAIYKSMSLASSMTPRGIARRLSGMVRRA